MEHRIIPPVVVVVESFRSAYTKLLSRDEPCWDVDERDDTPAERIVEACIEAPIPPGRALRICRWRQAGLFRDH